MGPCYSLRIFLCVLHIHSATIVAGCRNSGTVEVSQLSLAPRPAGQVTLACDYQVPSGQLLYLSWMIHEINTKIYGYNPTHNSTGTIYRPDIVLSANHNIFGHSEIVINTTVSDTWRYKCVMYLQDYNFCFDSKQIQFEAPELEIQADGQKICSSGNVPCYPFWSIVEGAHVISGHANNCQPDPVLILSVNGFNVPNAERRTNNKGYRQAIISALVDFSKDDVVSFTLIDNGQTYGLKYPYPVAECPMGELAVIYQNAPVPRPSGQVTLTCDYRVPPGQLLYIVWSIRKINSIIYSYNPTNNPPGIVNRPDIVLNATNDMTKKIGRSEIVIYPTVNDMQTYRCDVLLRDNSHCFTAMKVQFAPPDLEIRFNDAIVCKSTTSCHLDMPLESGPYLISGHVNNCHPNPALFLMVNGLHITADVDIGESQGFCQADIFAMHDFVRNDTVSFILIDNGKSYQWQYHYPDGPVGGPVVLQAANKTSSGLYKYITTAVILAVFIILAVTVLCFIKKIRPNEGNKADSGRGRSYTSTSHEQEHVLEYETSI